MTKSKQTDELDESMRVLSTGTCDTLTGSSRLTYHIGSLPDGEIYLRVHSNTGGGFFSREWISYQDIQQALKKGPAGKGITSILLHSLFRGKSVNTPAFLLAVLLHEKILRPMPGKLRRHEFLDDLAFMEKVDKLLSGGGDAKGKPAKTAGKPARAAPKRKSSAPSPRKKSKTLRGT
jgi:hypothetical protein